MTIERRVLVRGREVSTAGETAGEWRGKINGKTRKSIKRGRQGRKEDVGGEKNRWKWEKKNAGGERNSPAELFRRRVRNHRKNRYLRRDNRKKTE